MRRPWWRRAPKREVGEVSNNEQGYHEPGGGAKGAKLSRRIFLGGLGAMVATKAPAWPRLSALAATKIKSWSLEEFAANIQPGGPPKDGIPPIDRPKYVSAAEADKFLRGGDVVFGFDYRGVVKTYPQKILVWHEIVNEEVRAGRWHDKGPPAPPAPGTAPRCRDPAACPARWRGRLHPRSRASQEADP